MCMAGKIGAKINTNKLFEDRVKFLFGEDQSRYIVEVNNKDLEKVKKLISSNNIDYLDIGITQKDHLEIDEIKISIDNMLELNNKWFINYNSK